MAAGWLNPQDTANSTSSRPAHSNTGDGVRKWNQNGLTVDAKDVNAITAALRYLTDTAGITDSEGDDTLVYDAVAALTMTKLSGNTTFYVRTDGSDSNDGSANTAGAAWLTIQKAINVIANYNLNSYTATIQVADGTYTGAVSVTRPFVNGFVQLTGNTGTPSNCVISVAGAAVSVSYASMSLGGFKIVSSSGNLISIGSAAILTMNGAMEYGSCTNVAVSVGSGAQWRASANYTISGSPGTYFFSASGSTGIIHTSALTVTLSGTPNWPTAFINAARSSAINITSATFSGSATGKRFFIDETCDLLVGVGVDPDVYFPGDARGSIGVRIVGPQRHMRNLLLNGNGVLQGGPSGAKADDTYGLHQRWYGLTQSGTFTPSTTADIRNGIPYAMTLTNSHGSAQKLGYAQIVEGKSMKHLRGCKATLSAYARSSGSVIVRMSVLEWTGTEDTVTSDVVNNWASTTYTAGNFFISSTFNILSTTGITTNASTMTRGSLAVDVGSSANNLLVILWTESTVAATTGTVDLVVQLEEGGGSAGSLFDFRRVELEESLCARFYQSKTVRSENGSRHIPLSKMRSAPTVAVGVGSAANITADGFELSHSAAADCTVTATAEL